MSSVVVVHVVQIQRACGSACIFWVIVLIVQVV